MCCADYFKLFGRSQDLNLMKMSFGNSPTFAAIIPQYAQNMPTGWAIWGMFFISIYKISTPIYNYLPRISEHFQH